MSDPNREYDKTSLKIFRYNGIHRDYAAHFFRWGFISANVIKRHDRVLDIGCGVEAPLCRVLMNSEESLNMIPSLYLGVDFNELSDPISGRILKWAQFKGKFNFPKNWRKIRDQILGQRFNVITCLEVVEHMTMRNVRNLLIGAYELLRDDGTFVLSTPVFNGKMANNHINEMTIDQLGKEIRKAGFVIEKRFGTFASWNDIKRVVRPEHLAIAAELKRYYSGAVVSCFLAPLYPDAARNNVWICRRETTDDLL